MTLLPLAGGVCLSIMLIQGWVLALMRYLKLKPLTNLFPGYTYLVKSHVDYAIMAALLFGLHATIVQLGLTISKPALIALVIGALYNPFGFILQAVKPDIADTNSRLMKGLTLLGFIPATYGLGAVVFALITQIFIG